MTRAIEVLTTLCCLIAGITIQECAGRDRSSTSGARRVDVEPERGRATASAAAMGPRAVAGVAADIYSLLRTMRAPTAFNFVSMVSYPRST